VKTEHFELQSVHYMPKLLEAGILYVSEEFHTAAHICACGCGQKVRTPLGPTEWTVRNDARGPTLHPSVGNWQLPCKSHYLITNGNVQWSNQWTDKQIHAGRQKEHARRTAYYEAQKPNASWWHLVLEFVRRKLGS
jgi:N6-adenosine-specific RNA methylase IME4